MLLIDYLRDMVPLATIIGGLAAPTLAAIWAAHISRKNAKALEEIHKLVDGQRDKK
jgi:hypothetical protein